MITAYIKLSDYCDVGCDHCYLPQSVRDDHTTISDQTIKDVSEDIYQLAKINGTDKVLLMLHGGEVTSLPIEFVEQKMLLMESELQSRGLMCKQSIQTSGLYLNKEWVTYIQKYCGNHAGISFDLTARTLNGSAERYRDLLSKRLGLLRKHECSYGFVIAPSKRELGRVSEIVNYCVQEKVEYVTIDRYSDYGRRDPNKPTNREHSIFLIELLDDILARLKKDTFCPEFTILQAAISGILIGIGGDRWGTNCLENFIVIDKNGKTNSCPDKISYDKSFNEESTFIISEMRMDAIFDYKMNHKNLYCDTCEYHDWCTTGCPIMNNNPIAEGDCSGYKLFLNYLKTTMADAKNKEILKKYARL